MVLMQVHYSLPSLLHKAAWHRIVRKVFDDTDLLQLMGSVLMVSSGVGLSVLFFWHLIVISTGLGTVDAMTFRREN